MAKKYVYFIGEGSKEMKEILGGKGANINEMYNMGLAVPEAFTITTEVCDYYHKHDCTYPKTLQEEIDKNLEKLEKATGKKFGDIHNPLLLSVRSGASVSMPGMMDTVLNLGLNYDALKGMIERTENERFCYDIFRRFIQMFGNVVLGVDHHNFEEILGKVKKDAKVSYDSELTAEQMAEVVKKYLQMVKRKTKKDFPMDPREQLQMAIDAVFGSWNNDRAITYRRINDIRGLKGTAVNVQSMVFGNTGEESGTGVLFTRNPSTGENKLYGEYLMNAQGEDVVAGIRTPEDMADLKKKHNDIYEQIVDMKKLVENHYKDMQDMEFTIEDGKLYILQTRTGKRTAQAAINIAMDMLKEKRVTEKQALMMVDPESLDQVLHPFIDPKAPKELIAKGLPASPGAASGEVVFDSDKASKKAHDGKRVILVRHETSPDDIEGMHAAEGILTACGGMTSHAAVVARGMGRPCIAGATSVIIDMKKKEFTVKGKTIKEGDVITLDGSTGQVFMGDVPRIDPQLTGAFKQLMKLADKYRTLGVRTNADTGADSETALKFGAEGIGLCRTEHMFFTGPRIRIVQEMILSETTQEREAALKQLLPFQKKDFATIFKAMKGQPVTVRLLDPPLHEFLPDSEKDIKELAVLFKTNRQNILKKIVKLHEANPMLGHRGCRLLITYPEVARMQVTAIMKAALQLKKQGIKAIPEIEVPLVGSEKEFQMLREVIDQTAKEVDPKGEIHYTVGTMIELARACILADRIAEHADFFSFGTNDLTQTTFGFSRDDIGKFLPDYIEKNIIERDPFRSLDVDGVGELIKMAIKKGRGVKKDLLIGICGEHGGDTSSIKFFHKVGLDFVSCSPFRVPIAKLAAAQAAIGKK